MSGVAAHRFDNAKRRRPEHHARQAMLTPSYVLEPIRELLGGIGLDPCTESDNPTGATKFYHPPMDGCTLPWDAGTVFCNPPYGEIRARWVKRCIAEGTDRRVILLMPAHTETRTFQGALRACASVLFVRARLRFGVLRDNRRQEAASHGSAIFGFGVDVGPLRLPGVVLRRTPECETTENYDEGPHRPLGEHDPNCAWFRYGWKCSCNAENGS
jgi:DNA N-6-adenine-methyltransferase (Dam)